MRPEDWRPADGIELEPNADRAVRAAEGNQVVVAGPGTGKTELLAQRAHYLLSTGVCRYPGRILAISFKVDAATNLRQRTTLRAGREAAARLDSYTFHAFAKRLIDAFRPVLIGADALDADYRMGPTRAGRTQIGFQSLAPLATKILTDSPVARAALRQTYGFVFLDEFQDCTSDQFALIRAAFGGGNARLTAVGDPKQTVMRFAGAVPGVLGTFGQQFAAESLPLYVNRRSKPRLRRVQNAMVKVMDPPAAVADDSIVGEEGVVQILEFLNDDAEATAVAGLVHGLIKDGTSPGEIAVLACKLPNEHTYRLGLALRDLGVSFRRENQLQDLANEPVTQLILDFLLVTASEREPMAYARLLGTALSWREDVEGERQHAQLSKVIDVAKGLLERESQASTRPIVDTFLKHLGPALLRSLAPDYEQGPRLAQVIEETLEHLDLLLRQTGDLRQALREFTGEDAVKILSIHKAKGMEFDTVVVLAVENEMFWADPEDERCAYFVAISRARERLILTTSGSRATTPDTKWSWKVTRTPNLDFLDCARGEV